MAVLKKRNSSEWKSHQIFGFSVYSNFKFNNRFPVGNGKRDLTFTCNINDNRKSFWEHTQPSYASSNRNAKGECSFYVYRKLGLDILVFSQLAIFYVWLDRIVCKPLVDGQERLIEICLLGVVFSYWLELQGILALHASAVEVKRRAVAFLASNAGGKSSIAGTFVQHGYSLVTDDILPVEHLHNTVICRPGYPQMRLWPDLAKHFLGYYEHLDQVHPACSKRRVPIGFEGFGAFCDRSQPLTCIYIPDRLISEKKSTEIEIIPVSSAEAVIELIRHSFLSRVVESLGLHPRLELLAQTVMQVPVRRIRYSSGLDHLPRVRDAILKDLETL